MNILRISFLCGLMLVVSFRLSADSIGEKLKIEIIAKLFAKAQRGDWVLTETKKGYRTKTKVIDKQDKLLTLEIENIIKEKVESRTVQKIDLSLNKIIEATVFSNDGSVMRIPVDNLLFNKIQVTKYEQIKDERIAVDAGEFDCHVYKAIVDDSVVLLWINDAVPVNQIVKAKIKHAFVKLIDYGKNLDSSKSNDVVFPANNA